MKSSSGLILLFFIGTSFCADLLTTSAKCCSSKSHCCLAALKSNTRVNCFEGDGKAEAAAADCIQEELFESISLRFASFGDTECCAVFDLDDKDSAGACRSTCSTVMTSPSLSSKQKLDKVKTCREKNETYTCFRRCQMWLRDTASRSQPSAAFPVHELCNASFLMQAGRVYFGEKILR